MHENEANESDLLRPTGPVIHERPASAFGWTTRTTAIENYQHTHNLGYGEQSTLIQNGPARIPSSRLIRPRNATHTHLAMISFCHILCCFEIYI